MTFDSLAALVTLTILEIVLGIDNIVFIAVLSERLPKSRQARARTLGLLLAMGARIALLLAITWIMGLTATLVTVGEHPVTGKDLVMLAGGLFLIGKATLEIHHKLEQTAADTPGTRHRARLRPSMIGVLVQIMLIDVVFSLDSVITAVGMARQLWVMIAAIVIAVGVMMIFAGAVSRFIERHPTMKMLALAFLLLIGVMLVADGIGQHFPRGYIYFAMAFAFGVEMLNMKAGLRRKRKAAAA